LKFSLRSWQDCVNEGKILQQGCDQEQAEKPRGEWRGGTLPLCAHNTASYAG